MKFIQFLVLFFPVVFTSYADSRSEDRTWIGLFGKVSISEKLSIWNELQPRLDNDHLTLQQLLLRHGLLMKLDQKTEAGLLYGYIQTDRKHEHRPTLQLTQNWGTISLRNRIEFRMVEDVDAQSIRYRGAIRYQYPLANQRSLIIWEEPFINLTREDWTGDRFFERNRIFLGMGFEFLKTKLEMGYMNQLTPRNERYSYDHILTMYLFY